MGPTEQGKVRLAGVPGLRRLSPVQLVAVVASALVGLALLAACLVLLLIAAAPWGPCDPGVPACGPARGRLVGAGFLSAVLGAVTLGSLTVWLVRRRRDQGRPG